MTQNFSQVSQQQQYQQQLNLQFQNKTVFENSYLSQQQTPNNRQQSMFITQHRNEVTGNIIAEDGTIQSVNDWAENKNPENFINSVSYWDVVKLCQARCKDMKMTYTPQQLQKFIEIFGNKTENRYFDLQEQGFGFQSAKIIAKILEKNDHFIRINIGKNNFGDQGVQRLVFSLKKNKNIVSVDFSNTGITYIGLQSIFEMVQNSQNIINLDVSSREGFARNKLGFEGFPLLKSFLHNLNLLQFLDLSNSALGSNGLSYVINGLKNNKILNYLALGNNGIDNQCGEKFRDLLKSTALQELNLYGNKIGDEFLIQIGEALKNGQNMSDLEILNISYNKFTPAGLNYFCKSIARNTTLFSLNLDGNSLEADNLHYLQMYLQENKFLKNLSMKYCNLNNDAIDSIGQGLCQNSTIVKLNLSGNFMHFGGVSSLAKAFSSGYCAIKYLELFKCGIDDNSGVILVKSFTGNRYLTHIDLRKNMMGDDTGYYLKEAIKDNVNIYKLQIDKNLIRYDYCLEIWKNLKHNKQHHKNQLKGNLNNKVKDYQSQEKQSDIMEIKFELEEKKIFMEREIQQLTQITENETIKLKQKHENQLENLNNYIKQNKIITEELSELKEEMVNDNASHFAEVSNIRDKMLNCKQYIKKIHGQIEQTLKQQKIRREDMLQMTNQKKIKVLEEQRIYNKVVQKQDSLTNSISILQKKIEKMQQKIDNSEDDTDIEENGSEKKSSNKKSQKKKSVVKNKKLSEIGQQNDTRKQSVQSSIRQSTVQSDNQVEANEKKQLNNRQSKFSLKQNLINTKVSQTVKNKKK